MSTRRGNIGAWGEAQAGLFLERHGFAIVERNYHATVGEIDIVATKGDDYYFVEVKTRKAGDLAFDTAITGDKKRKLLKTIKHYCYHRRIRDRGLVPVSLLAVYDPLQMTLRFRFAVLY